MLRASWNGIVLAEAPRTVRLEGNHYFPPESLNERYFAKSRSKTLCPWKGLASYYDLTLAHTTIKNAAWYYPHPSPLARRIKNHVAFRPGVRITREPEPPGPNEGQRLRGRSRELLASERRPRMTVPADAVVTVYWRPGCLECSQLLGDLDRLGLPVTKLNIGEDAVAATRMRTATNGNETVPTVLVDGQAMVKPPATAVLDAVLAAVRAHARALLENLDQEQVAGRAS